MRLIRTCTAFGRNISQKRFQSSQNATESALEHCRNQLHKFDYNSYLCSLFLPAADRPLAWAIGAFNIETAQVRDIVSDVNVGKMRLSWWRQTIDQIFTGNSPPHHPVALGLAYAVQRRSLSKRWFLRIINERVFFYLLL
jgi:NADH dehydrogenase [ubiquinone] 1 alpha subcomplex assembly factor 6